MHLTSLEAAAILLALSGSGGWKAAAAIARRARAIEQAVQLLAGLTASHQLRLDAQDQLHARMETTPWTHPPANTATPPDQGLPPPAATPTR